MSTFEELRLLVRAFQRSRGVGHTRAALAVAGQVGAVFVAGTADLAAEVRRTHHHLEVVHLARLEALRGGSRPIVVDHFALELILGSVLSALDAEREGAKIRAEELARLAARLDARAEAIDRAQARAAAAAPAAAAPRGATLDDVAAFVADVRARYPEDVFPPDSPSPDANAARMARHLCGVFAAELERMRAAAPETDAGGAA